MARKPERNHEAYCTYEMAYTSDPGLSQKLRKKLLSEGAGPLRDGH